MTQLPNTEVRAYPSFTKELYAVVRVNRNLPQKRVTKLIIECWVKMVNDPTFDNLRIWLNSALNNLFTSYVPFTISRSIVCLRFIELCIVSCRWRAIHNNKRQLIDNVNTEWRSSSTFIVYGNKYHYLREI